MKIAVAGTGYVGLSLATLLSQKNEVVALDVIPEKVEKINNRISPIQDEYIEKYFNIRRSTATGLLNSLEKNGYITKEPVENDKRMKKIKATEHAYSTVEKIDNHVIQLEKIMLDGIDEKEVKQFRNTISKMTLNLVKESKNG